ncbi:MAG: H-NS histone family protein [Pseudomonadota bacterium]
MTEKQLTKLAGDVAKEVEGRAKKNRDAAMKAATKAAKDFGFALDELVVKTATTTTRKRRATPAKKKTTPAPAKFRNPADPKQTWSGRGRRPEWYKAAEKAGKLKDLEIKAK